MSFLGERRPLSRAVGTGPEGDGFPTTSVQTKTYDGGGGCHVATSDPIVEIIGDYRAFAAMQRDRLLARGIDIAPYPLSHLAVRVADWDLYVD
jgi:hypothetical protein